MRFPEVHGGRHADLCERPWSFRGPTRYSTEKMSSTVGTLTGSNESGDLPQLISILRHISGVKQLFRSIGELRGSSAIVNALWEACDLRAPRSLVHKCGKRDVELHNRVLESANTDTLADFEELRQCADEVLDQEVWSSGSAKMHPSRKLRLSWRRQLSTRACMILSPTGSPPIILS